MDIREEFRRAAQDKGLPAEITEKWIRSARPQLGLTRTDGPAIARIGGKPVMPADQEWPAGQSLIATVDLARLPAGSHDLTLPEAGRLLFFADTLDGVDYANVIFVPPDAECVERDLPDASGGDIIEPIPLNGTSTWTLPESDELVPGLGEHATTVHEIMYALEYRNDEVLFSIGGWSLSLFGAGGYAVRSPEKETLLAAAHIPEDLGIFPSWDMDTMLSYVIDHEDLAAGRFDRVRPDFDWAG